MEPKPNADDSTQVPPGAEAAKDRAPSPTQSMTARLVEVLDGYLGALQDGEAPSRADLLAQYPELADQLDACLAGIDFIQSADTSAGGDAPQLNDFRILREVGRGGMGAVYEAEQLSLGRRVALKVLRFGAVSDPEALSRFQREAETVAKLHHTHIVPIYSVGSEGGVNFYAMQFISGDSLDRALQQSVGQLDLKTVARWGWQAADALAHAHERHVVHRDVKPSNLMLDEDERIWLTDFGLAKRLDDITLSMTGALLGTPRYMSPEQAAASGTEIDHRTDIYSLGATLYELATGKPVFAADTHLGVIGQILEEQPAPPRSVRPSIPRDLETILLKCLRKEPADRYGSADELAEDLRAFVQDRPIRARRPSLLEKSRRWFREHRQKTLRTGVTMLATAALMLVGVLGFQAYRTSQQGLVELQSDSPLVARVVDRSGHAQTVTLPTQAPLELAAGEVQVSLVGQSTFGETFTASVEPRQRTQFEPQPDSVAAVEGLDLSRGSLILPTPEGTQLLRNDDQGVSCFDMATRRVRWKTNLRDLKQEKFADLGWPWPSSDLWVAGEFPHLATGDDRQRPAPSDADLDLDGTPDVILAGKRYGGVLALSGSDGRPLWHALGNQADRAVAVLVEPTVVGDLNADQHPDAVVIWGAFSVNDPFDVDRQELGMAAISGADGTTLWRRPFQHTWCGLPKKREVPSLLRWFPGGKQATTAGVTDSTYRHEDLVFRSKQRQIQSHGFARPLPQAPRVLAAPDGLSVATLVGSHLIVTDCQDGSILQVQDLGLVPLQEVAWGDFDGDGGDDLAVLDQPPGDSLRCVVWSIQSGRALWERALDVSLGRYPDHRDVSPHWPLAVDMDGDGKDELLIPTASSASSAQRRVPWGELSLLRGEDGSEIWQRQRMAMDQQIDHFAVGPDIDGDGQRDVFLATLWGREFDLYVEALSGVDGHPLWWTKESLPPAPSGSIDYTLGPIRFWEHGADGWPQLLAQAHPDNGVGESKVCVLSAGTGALQYGIYDAQKVLPLDAEGDGHRELFVFRRDVSLEGTVRRTLEVVPNGQVRWRRLAGSRWDVLPDLNGDGCYETVSYGSQGMARVICGATGKRLWERQGDNYRSLRFQTQPDRGRDVDGDGVPDLLAWQGGGASSQWQVPFLAISGSDGRVLWRADVRVHCIEDVPHLSFEDVDQDGEAEVVLVAGMDYRYADRQSVSTSDQQLWLIVLEGRDGQVRWEHALTAPYGASSPNGSPPFHRHELAISVALADLNGDEVAEIVVPAETEARDGVEQRVLDGKTGEALWRYRLPAHSGRAFEHVADVSIVDLDGAGPKEVLLTALEERSAEGGRTEKYHHLVALTADGAMLWQWEARTPRLFDWYHHEPLDRRGPVIVPSETGRPHISLPFTSPSMGTQSRLVMLNYRGEPVWERQFESSIGYRIWPAGPDHVALTNVQRILGLPVGSSEEPRWLHELGGENPGSDAKVIRALGASPVTLLLRRGAGDNSLEAVDARTGAWLWKCPGPTPRNRFGWISVSQQALLNPSAADPPLVFFQHGHVAQSRRGTLRSPKSVEVPGRLAATVTPAADDPRLLRQLPWNDHVSDIAEVLQDYWMWATFYCLTLILIPLGMLAFLTLRRRFGTRTLAVLPIVVACVLWGYRTPGPEPIVFLLWQKLLIGVGFLPILAIGVLMLYWIVTQQWKVCRFWLAVACTLTLVWTLLLLVTSGYGQGAWFPGERYAWDGWYWVALLGGYSAGWAMLGTIPAQLRQMLGAGLTGDV